MMTSEEIPYSADGVDMNGGAGHSFTNPEADGQNMPGIAHGGPTDLFGETIGIP